MPVNLSVDRRIWGGRCNTSSWSKLISENDYNFLLVFDCGVHGDDQTRRTLLRNNSNLVAMTFLKLLENLSKDETIQYILIMIDDMLQEDRKHAEIFHDYCAGKKESVWEHFLHLLNRTDEFIVHMSSRIIAKIACWSQELMNESDLEFYLAWLRDQLRKDTIKIKNQML